MEHNWLNTSPLELARQLDAMAARFTADAHAIRQAVADTPIETTPDVPFNLLSIAELATLLGVSRTAVYSLRYEGKGPPFIRIGNRVRYRPQDVDAWLRQHSETGER